MKERHTLSHIKGTSSGTTVPNGKTVEAPHVGQYMTGAYEEVLLSPLCAAVISRFSMAYRQYRLIIGIFLIAPLPNVATQTVEL